MIKALGWIVWCAGLFLSVGFIYQLRRFVAAGREFQWATATHVFIFTATLLVFPVLGWNKVHLMWALPLSWALALVLSLPIPLMTPIIRRMTSAFMTLVLVGVRRPEEIKGITQREVGHKPIKTEEAAIIQSNSSDATHFVETTFSYCRIGDHDKCVSRIETDSQTEICDCDCHVLGRGFASPKAPATMGKS